MRNLKKLLALVLALVMTMSLVAVANAADYKDVDDDDEYATAIDVMSAIGVIDGVGNNSFDPDGTITREQAAKIVATMLLGSSADDLGTNTQIFSDVAAGRWSAGYIAYCANKGILSGVGGGKFDPAGILTGAQFGKMLLVALGYDPKYEGYTGASWAINVASDMLMSGVNVDGVLLSAPLPRAQAAQMALNTLTADLVEYNGRIDATIGDNNITVSNPASKIEQKSGATDYTTANGLEDEYVQFCERYFPDLELDGTDTDAFGRTVDTWSYKNEDVCSDDSGNAVVVYTAKTGEDDVKKDLKSYSLKADGSIAFGKSRVWVDGVQEGSDNNTTSAIVTAVYGGEKGIEDLTGNGRVVEVYADGKEITKIVVINAHLAKVVSVDEKKETVTYKTVDTTVVNNNINASETGYGKVEKDDYVMINIKASAAPDSVKATYAVASDVLAVAPATKVTGNITKVVKDESVTVGGTVYDFSAVVADEDIKSANADNSLVDAYLDTYGYMVYNTANTDAGNYMMVTKQSWGTPGALGDSVYKVQGVLTDGTIGVFEVSKTDVEDSMKAVDDGNNKVVVGLYSYVVSGGKYELAKVDDSSADYGHKAASATIDKSTVALQTGKTHYFADDVNFIVIENSGKDSMTAKVYTGKQVIDGSADVYYLTDKEVNQSTKANITTAFVLGSVANPAEDLIFAADNNADGSQWIDGEKYDTYEVYINGEKDKIPVNPDKTPTVGFNTYTVDSKGVYSLVTKTTGGVSAAQETLEAFGQYLKPGTSNSGNALRATDDVKVIDVAGKGIDSMSKLADASGAQGWIVFDSEAGTVSMIYVTTAS